MAVDGIIKWALVSGSARQRQEANIKTHSVLHSIALTRVNHATMPVHAGGFVVVLGALWLDG
eukprot:5556128-Amphidinium_carterae.1